MASACRLILHPMKFLTETENVTKEEEQPLFDMIGLAAQRALSTPATPPVAPVQASVAVEPKKKYVRKYSYPPPTRPFRQAVWEIMSDGNARTVPEVVQILEAEGSPYREHLPTNSGTASWVKRTFNQNPRIYIDLRNDKYICWRRARLIKRSETKVIALSR